MKTTPKQTTEETAVKPSALDKTQNCAIVKTIAFRVAIDKVYWATSPVVKQTLFFIRIIIWLLREAGNRWCCPVRSTRTPTAKAFFMSGKEA